MTIMSTTMGEILQGLQQNIPVIFEQCNITSEEFWEQFLVLYYSFNVQVECTISVFVNYSFWLKVGIHYNVCEICHLVDIHRHQNVWLAEI